MGKREVYRGDPEQKQFYLLNDFSGGLNTEFSDDSSPDNEVFSLVNFDIDKRGSLYQRKGFGKNNAISQLLSKVPELPRVKPKFPENPNPEFENDNIVYAKLLKNDNRIWRNLLVFSGPDAYRQYQAMWGYQNNSFEILMITTTLYSQTSDAWFIKVTLPDLEYNEFGIPTSTDTSIVEYERINLPVIFTYKNNLFNIETIEYFDKIYFTNNDKALVIFDRSNNTFRYAGTNVPETPNTAYKPNGMEVRKIGFNVLGDDPLYWVDYQGIATNSIQGVYLTTFDNKPTLNLPFGGKFRINILYTGSDSGFTIGFKEGDRVISFTSALNTTLSKPNLKVYDITINEVPSNEVEIKIEKTGAGLDPYYDYYTVGAVDPEQKAVTPLNVGDCGILEMYNRAVYYKGDTIWFSEFGKFDYVPNYNYVSLPIEPTDKIVKIIFFRNIHVVFTRYRIYKMIGAFGSPDFEVKPINMGIGCIAPNTVVPIENELYFASDKGLYSLKAVEFQPGLENVKELDKKVKSLTSGVILNLGGRFEDPEYVFEGILENAYAIRYKDKYMLFYNASLANGDLSSLMTNDALIYNYEMKNYTSYEFSVKPSFMFMIDGFIQCLQTVPIKEEYTLEETLFEFDFENASGNVVTDLTGNGYDLTLVGGAKLNPGVGVKFDNTPQSLKVFNIPSTFNIENGLSISFDVKLDNLLGGKLINLEQSQLAGSALPTSGTIATPWSNGYRADFAYTTVPNIELKKSVVNYIITLYRQSASINAVSSGNSILNEGLNNLLPQSNFSFNFGSNLKTIIRQGSFEVLHDSQGNYSKNWSLVVNTTFPVTTFGDKYVNGPLTLSNGANFNNYATSTSIFNAYFKATFKPTATGSNILFKNYSATGLNGWEIGLDSSSRVYFKSTFNGTSAIRTSSYVATANNWHTVEVRTTGGSTSQVFVNGVSIGTNAYRSTFTNIRNATIGSNTIQFKGVIDVRGTNYSNSTVQRVCLINISNGTTGTALNLNGGDGSVTGGNIIQESSTTWSPLRLSSGDSTVVLNRITDRSFRPITISTIDGTQLKLDIESETHKDSITISGLDLTNIHSFKIDIVPIVNGFRIDIYKDGVVETTKNVAIGLIKNGLRDNSFVHPSGENVNFTIYNFELRTPSTYILYDFLEGSGSTVFDKSGNGFNGVLNNNPIWVVDSGLRLNGVDGYGRLPDITEDVKFSNGFYIEFESKFNTLENSMKILDLATDYDSGNTSNGRASINVYKNKIVDAIGFKSSSLNNRVADQDHTEAGLQEKVKWLFDFQDTGSGYKLSIKKDGILVEESDYSYGSVTNILRKSNFIGRSNNPQDGYFDGMLYNLKMVVKASVNPTIIYETLMFEFEYTHTDFGRPIRIHLQTMGVNMGNPMHIKKVKNIFVKGLGGIIFNRYTFGMFADGHLVNNVKKFYVYFDEDGQLVYDYTRDGSFALDEAISVLGTMRLDETRLGYTSYETRKMIIPSTGKNFIIDISGESESFLGLESIGFTYKLGKVKER